MRISLVLEYHFKIGPLIKILVKMVQDFCNFIVMYTIMCIMFALVGNINFLYDVQDFHSFFNSILTVIDSSIGNFNFLIFDTMRDSYMQTFGQVYLVLIAIIFNIMILNLLISALANTYHIFDKKSNGLYLSKILSTRDEMTYDPCYGAFLSSMPPLNIIQLPFIPYSLLVRYGDEKLIMLCRYIMRTQYTIMMLIPFTFFIVVSLILIPLAWPIGITDKIKSLFRPDEKTFQHKLINAIIFVPLGPFILILDFVKDLQYFWINNFRKNLHKIIIEREKSSISHRSLKELQSICEKYQTNKIKSTHSVHLIQYFRKKFKVHQNIQFLIFG